MLPDMGKDKSLPVAGRDLGNNYHVHCGFMVSLIFISALG